MATSDEHAVGRDKTDSSTDPGSKLKTAREAQELTIAEIAAELRIGVPYLIALEHGDYEALGPPVFAKGYLKQYGARLGLNIPELVDDYERTAGNRSIEIAPSRTIKLHDQRQITVWVVAAFVLAVISAIIWFWWWLGTERAELPALTTSEDAPAVPVEAVSRVPTQTAPAIEAPPTPPVTNDEADPETDAPTESAAETEAAAGLPADPDPQSDPDPDPATAPAAEPFLGPELEIVFLADSWTDITTGTGERLFYDLGRAGTIATVPADRDMNLFFGNAAGVELRIDGEPYEIPATASRRGNTAQWELAGR